MDPLYVQFDPSACVSNPADCIDLIVDPSTGPCDNLPLEGVYSGNVNVHEYPGDYVSKTQVNHSPLTYDPAIWNVDLRSAKFQFLGGSTTSGFRHDVRYIAVGKTNTYGGRMCRNSNTNPLIFHPSDNNYLYPPEYSDTAVLPTLKSGRHFTGSLSHPSGFEESVTFFCYQDLLTWYLSLLPDSQFIPDNSYLANPPYQSYYDNAVALGGVFDLNGIISTVQSDVLIVYTDSELC